MFSFEHMILVLLKFEDLLCYAWHKQVFNGQAPLGSVVVAFPELFYMHMHYAEVFTVCSHFQFCEI